MLKLNKIKLNELNEINNEWYNNIEDVKNRFVIEGMYKFKCDGDCNILIDSIESVYDNDIIFEKVLENVIGIKDGYEYINYVDDNYNNIEVLYEDYEYENVCIVRRKDNNEVFKLCYDNGESLCEVYKFKNDEYIDSDEGEVY